MDILYHHCCIDPIDLNQGTILAESKEFFDSSYGLMTLPVEFDDRGFNQFKELRRDLEIKHLQVQDQAKSFKVLDHDKSEQ